MSISFTFVGECIF